jgi:hypothetical protein
MKEGRHELALWRFRGILFGKFHSDFIYTYIYTSENEYHGRDYTYMYNNNNNKRLTSFPVGT